MTKANFQKWADVPATEMTPEINRRFITGEKVMSVYLSMDKGGVIPNHHHPHEQITHVISGKIEYTVGDETRVMSPGEVVFIPPNLPHTGVALEETRMIEVFSPPREDFLE
ncbi:MAG: cupin domain-containing protein [Chloroflexota bacterium]